MNATTAIPGFSAPVTIGSQKTIPVYVSETGTKPLIVLHELPGMSDSFITYCQRMTQDEGFKVYMPLLFKSPGTNMKKLETIMFCMSREFKSLFAANRDNTRPFTAWMLELVNHVADDHPGANVGLVGMCLTGGFAIAAIADPRVTAVASCQPAFPFFRNISTLGLSPAERQNARAGIADKVLPCVKAYRYQHDMLSRESHMAAAKTLMGDALERFPDLPGNEHSTLTTASANPEVFEDVVHFMRARL